MTDDLSRVKAVIKEIGLLPEEIARIDMAPITTQVYILEAAVGNIVKRLGKVPVYHKACAFEVEREQ